MNKIDVLPSDVLIASDYGLYYVKGFFPDFLETCMIWNEEE